MIQGCRDLRRSTDRWFLSKNSTTRHKGLDLARRPVLLYDWLILTDAEGLYLYPGTNMTPNRLRLQNLWKIKNTASCSSRIRLQFSSSSYLIHVIVYPRAPLPLSVESPVCRMMTYFWTQAPLPNASEKRLVVEWSFYQTRSICQPLLGAKFWC
jgi:hypothetical protein